MSKFLSPTLAAVTPYTPGEQPQDQQYIKLNTNESPYLPSPAVIAAVSEHEVEKLRLYSDPACADLLKAAAAHFGLQPEQIMPGNGSDENLFFALRAFCDADHPLAYADITYGCYGVWCGLMHIPSHIIPLKEDFTLDPKDYYGLNQTIVLANPNVIGAYAPIGAGIPGHKLHNSIGVMKAYSSCVGDGPFTAELAMTEEEKHDLREAGHEYGAATGRPRRVGPIDLVASRYGVFCQGCDEVALTLLDVLDYMEKIPMVTAYKLTDGSTTTRFPMGEALDTAQPVVEYLPGWHCDITAARKWEDLPKEARDYVEYLEKAVGCKITYISVGAEREAYIHHV